MIEHINTYRESVETILSEGDYTYHPCLLQYVDLYGIIHQLPIRLTLIQGEWVQIFVKEESRASVQEQRAVREWNDIHHEANIEEGFYMPGSLSVTPVKDLTGVGWATINDEDGLTRIAVDKNSRITVDKSFGVPDTYIALTLLSGYLYKIPHSQLSGLLYQKDHNE